MCSRDIRVLPIFYSCVKLIIDDLSINNNKNGNKYLFFLQ